MDNSSVEELNSRNSLRKRISIDDHLAEATTRRRRLTTSLNDEMKPNSKVQNRGPTFENVTYLDDLPPEILEVVLQRSSTEDLLNFRRLNHKWNELSSRTLRYRADKAICFRFKNGHFMEASKDPFSLMGMKYVYKNKTLKDLVDCMNRSEHFPCSYFDFGDLNDFGNEDFNNFLSIWGENILSLKIIMFDPINGLEPLRKLLSQQVPNLKKLEIQFHWNGFKSNENIGSPSTQLFADSKPFQLPKLQVLVVDHSFRDFLRIIADILLAACNLEEFETPSSFSRDGLEDILIDTITIEDLQMLQSLNKLHCVKKLQICLSEDLMTYWGKTSEKINLNLESLCVAFMDIVKNQEQKSRATSIINQLLESGKDVVELAMEPMGLLPAVAFPVLKKLKKLELYGNRSKTAMFPASIEMAVVFPNLKELDIRLPCVGDQFPSSPITSIPSVEVLRILSCDSTASKLMKITPNVKLVSFQSVCTGSFGEDVALINGFRAILTNLTKLKAMNWTIFGMTHEELLFTLDAAVTGLSQKLCKEMSEKFRNRDHLSTVELVSIGQLREHSSITVLKDLTKLDIHFLFEPLQRDAYSEKKEQKKDEAGYTKKDIFFETGLTKVSQFLCFDLMPNLEINILKTLD